MVDPKPLLMGFGAGADVVSQIATDKAINPRRRTAASRAVFDITRGELIKDVEVPGIATVPHSLGRVPEGAEILKASALGETVCVDTSVNDVTIASNGTVTVTLWVV